MREHAELLRRLAVPRLAGSDAGAQVVVALEAELAARGLVVDRHRCRMAATSLAFTGWLGLVAATCALAGSVLPLLDPLRAAYVVLLLSGVALGTAAMPRARTAVARLLGARPVDGVTLVARMPGDRPRVWLTAHHDSKGQRLSMAGRLVAVGAMSTGWIALVSFALLQCAGNDLGAGGWVVAGAWAGAGGVGTYLCGRPGASPGAVDNASGVVAVLAVLDALPKRVGLGVILPDGEEFGLQGARALLRDAPELFRETTVINFDGIDDEGHTIAFVHRPGPVTAAIAAALRARPRRRLPVLVDGQVFARASRECMTVLRGSWRTASLVHTPRDTADRLSLAGVRDVASGVARALRHVG